ncbi:MAG: Chromosomal replication initiator protein DnaA [Clostridiales bacterium 38_11]|nr:MAG: Chromosomal replication initiator protein DnaA [Clostridiales bacterium 38_11]HBH12200.1 chromosomal replication initiator protein DnaA [Clostridiales bacterium]
MNNSIAQLWDEVLAIIKEDMNEVSYNTWLKPIKPLHINNNVIYLQAPEEFLRDMLVKRYNNLLKNAFTYVLNDNEISIKILIPDEEIDEQKMVEKRDKNFTYQNGNTIKSFLNPKYKFDSFIVGNSNRFAHAASLAVAEAPATAYNPLFLYGGVGLGKTHLMHAIGHYIMSNNKDSKILYVTSEKFTNDLINSIKDDKNEAFRNKYRKIDVLLVDDIQFIAGKERTQEEFFHTFNALHNDNKQIIISSDRPPKEILTLEDRLRSRFEMGLTADVQTPDLETRIAILRKKAEDEKYDVSDEIIEYIANNIQSNIRKLEGALIRLYAYSSLTNKEVTMELAYEALKHLISDKNKLITIDLIKNAISNYFNISLEDLSSKKKPKSISHPRQVAMYLSRKHTDNSLPKIGDEFGGRDHSTVIHAFNKITADLETDNELKKAIEDLEAELL